MPQVISYRGFFISPSFNVVLLNQVIQIAENIFNSLPRKSTPMATYGLWIALPVVGCFAKKLYSVTASSH